MMPFCILRAPGTNCDIETKYALEHFGCRAEIVHVNQFLKGKKDLSAYSGLVIPGGFSYGDHIRSGAIMGKIVGKKLGTEITKMADEGKPILGICNGFQVLVESGILPRLTGRTLKSQAALGTNTSSKFEDRWVYLRNENRGNCIFTRGVKKLTRMPVAHAEGKLILPLDREKEYLNYLEEHDQMAFRYATNEGELAKGKYPENPNGSIADIAGICDQSGIVMGMMPHPERAFRMITYPDWTRTGAEGFGDGYAIFKNMVDYAKKV
jgi:phosphoribosylformylglycinamidine synthase